MNLSVFLMFVYAVGYEALRVHGPSDPLVAQLGGSVLLPCFIESPLPVEDLQVEWRKLDTDSVVSLFQQGENRADLQTQVFRDRADFFPHEISKGNFSILLRNVVKEDAGVYRCRVNTTHNTGHVIMEIKDIKHLVVTGVNQPVFARDGEDVVLNCSVDSHVPTSEIEEVTWKKTDGDKDVLVLLYQESEIFSDSSHESYQGRVDLFLSEIPKGNFSLKLKDVKMEDKGEFTCEVHTSDMSGSITVVLYGVEHLVVTGVNQPIFAREGEDVVLNCSVDSHVPTSEIEEVTWKKTDGDNDVLVLLYQESEIFSDSSHESYQGRVDFFLSEIPKGNFSLKLKDVKMEDKGDYTCEVHTSDMSGSITVVLHGVGFSSLHILILVFCVTALLLAVGFCGPVFNLLRNKVNTKKAIIIHISLVLCPNICMFISFCLWSTVGFRAEVITSLTVSIMRPIMLIKTSLYLDKFPQILQKAVKKLAVPLYHSSLILGACLYLFNGRIQTTGEKLNASFTALAVLFVIGAVLTAVYDFQIHLTGFLIMLNMIMLALSVSISSSVFYKYEVDLVIPTLAIGIVIVLSLQRLFLEEPFGCVHITLSSFMVALYSVYEIVAYILFSVNFNDFVTGWISVFLVVFILCAWLVVIYLLRFHRVHGHRCCSQWRKIGYLCSTVITVILFTSYITMSFYYTSIVLQIKERAGLLALMALLHVLPVICLFKHPEHLPEVFHMMVYMFGAVGLSTVNAIGLITELILKSEKGGRTIEDLRVIILPFETLFVFAWLTLQIYDSWMRYKDGVQHRNEDEKKGPEVVPEMEALRENVPNPD